MNQDRNNLDRFLEGLTTEGNKKIEYTKVYERPSKAKSIIGFIISLICLVIIIGLFTFNVMYFVILIVCILSLVFFSINTFTEKGFGLPKTIAYIVEPEEEEEPEEVEEDNSSFYDEEQAENEDEDDDWEERQ